MNPINVLNPRHSALVAGRSPSLPHFLLATPIIGPTRLMDPPMYDKGPVSPPKTYQSTIWPRSFFTWSKVVYFEAVLYRQITEKGQASGYFWAPTPFSTSGLMNWKNSNSSYTQDPQRMADLIASIFVTHQPNWADI